MQKFVSRPPIERPSTSNHQTTSSSLQTTSSSLMGNRIINQPFTNAQPITIRPRATNPATTTHTELNHVQMSPVSQSANRINNIHGHFRFFTPQLNSQPVRSNHSIEDQFLEKVARSGLLPSKSLDQDDDILDSSKLIEGLEFNSESQENAVFEETGKENASLEAAWKEAENAVFEETWKESASLEAAWKETDNTVLEGTWQKAEIVVAKEDEQNVDDEIIKDDASLICICKSLDAHTRFQLFRDTKDLNQAELAAILRNRLQTQADKSLDRLNLRNSGITHLTGEIALYFPNVTYINAENSQIVKVSPSIQNLKNLQKISFRGSELNKKDHADELANARKIFEQMTISGLVTVSLDVI